MSRFVVHSTDEPLSTVVARPGRCTPAGAAVVLLLLTAIAVSAGCSRQGDYDFLVWHAITAASQQNNGVTVVLGRDLPPQAREAASRRYPTLDETEVEPVPGFDLAPGLVVLQAVRLEGWEAQVKVLAGPIHAGANLECGRTVDATYHRTSSGWEPGEVAMIVC